MAEPKTAANASSRPNSATTRVRKRASKACLCCRARKVRCDVSQRGRPCMNCYLDGETCIVTGRASKQASRPLASSILSPVILSAVSASRSASLLDEENDTVARGKETQHRSTSTTHNDGSITATTSKLSHVENVSSSLSEAEHTQQAKLSIHRHASNKSDGSSATLSQNASQNALPTQSSSEVVTAPSISLESNPALNSRNSQNADSAQLPFKIPLEAPPQTTLNTFSLDSPPAALTHSAVPMDITYTYYPFLTFRCLPKLLPQDVNYLEQQGCMKLPLRPILDEFVQQYFLHVHPMMPLFHEGDFWDQYSQQDAMYETDGVAESTRMPLLVFQALLFATCNFVSESSVRALGFPTIRAARAVLYRRAKLLYDFDTESSAVACSQAALLLTFWSPYGNKKVNTVWLSIAIQQARLAEAHLYASLPQNNIHTSALKRLWWCCIIRDRLLSLGVRRSILIPRTQFDIDRHPPLGAMDLADEIAYSRVYNLEAKKGLVAIIARIAELCVVLTDVLTLAYPPDVLTWDSQNDQDRLQREGKNIEKCKLALDQWYCSVSSRFTLFNGTANDAAYLPGQQVGVGNNYCHDSVILYTNLMYMYYHSGRIALCHHEALSMILYDSVPKGHRVQQAQAMPAILENRHELQHAATEVIECLKELVRRRLARWLPISAVPITAFPLFLQTVDVKLSSSSSTTTTLSRSGSSGLKQRHLNILVEAMKTYAPQYEGVDWVSESICHAVNLAQLDGLPSPSQTGHHTGNVYDWTDILATNPSCYLRLAFSMDIALRTNRLPEEHDFPASLRGLFAGGFSPIRSLFCSAAIATATAGLNRTVARFGSTTPTPTARIGSPTPFKASILQESVYNTTHASINDQQTQTPPASTNSTSSTADASQSVIRTPEFIFDDGPAAMDDFTMYYDMDLRSMDMHGVDDSGSGLNQGGNSVYGFESGRTLMDVTDVDAHADNNS